MWRLFNFVAGWYGCVDFLGSIPLMILVGLGLVARLAVDVAFLAQAVNTYVFGVIAENLVLGRGFSNFAATPSGVVVDEAHVGTPLPSAFMPPLYVGTVLVASAGSRLVEAGPDGVVWFVRFINLVLACVTMVGLASFVSLLCSARAAWLAVLGFAIYLAFCLSDHPGVRDGGLGGDGVEAARDGGS